MKTIKRIANRDYVLEEDGKSFLLEKGREYTTSPEGIDLVIGPGPRKGNVTVYANMWASIPIKMFEPIVEGA